MWNGEERGLQSSDFTSTENLRFSKRNPRPALNPSLYNPIHPREQLALSAIVVAVIGIVCTSVTETTAEP